MRKVDYSIITACHEAYRKYLPDLADSIKGVREEGAEWILVLDGIDIRHGRLPCESPDILLCSPYVQGAAAAKNRGLGYVQTELVASVDADDIVVEEGLAASANLLSMVGDRYGFVQYYCKDFRSENGIPEDIYSMVDVDSRTWAPGKITRHIRQLILDDPDSQWMSEYSANCTVYRTEAVLEAGGWCAMPISEDLKLLADVGARHWGIESGLFGLWRRLHGDNSILREEYRPERSFWEQQFLQRTARTTT